MRVFSIIRFAFPSLPVSRSTDSCGMGVGVTGFVSLRHLEKRRRSAGAAPEGFLAAALSRRLAGLSLSSDASENVVVLGASFASSLFGAGG